VPGAVVPSAQHLASSHPTQPRSQPGMNFSVGGTGLVPCIRDAISSASELEVSVSSRRAR